MSCTSAFKAIYLPIALFTLTNMTRTSYIVGALFSAYVGVSYTQYQDDGYRIEESIKSKQVKLSSTLYNKFISASFSHIDAAMIFSGVCYAITIMPLISATFTGLTSLKFAIKFSTDILPLLVPLTLDAMAIACYKIYTGGKFLYNQKRDNGYVFEKNKLINDYRSFAFLRIFKAPEKILHPLFKAVWDISTIVSYASLFAECNYHKNGFHSAYLWGIKSYLTNHPFYAAAYLIGTTALFYKGADILIYAATILDPVCSNISQFIKARSSRGGVVHKFADFIDDCHQKCEWVHTDGERETRDMCHLSLRVGGPLFFIPMVWFNKYNKYMNDLFIVYSFSAPLPLSFKIALTGIVIDTAIAVACYFSRQEYLSLSKTFGKLLQEEGLGERGNH